MKDETLSLLRKEYHHSYVFKPTDSNLYIRIYEEGGFPMACFIRVVPIGNLGMMNDYGLSKSEMTRILRDFKKIRDDVCIIKILAFKCGRKFKYERL